MDCKTLLFSSYWSIKSRYGSCQWSHYNLEEMSECADIP